MITKFESTEEKKFLHDLLWQGVQSTDIIFSAPEGIDDYIKIMIKFRQRCFAYLEEEDPNQSVIQAYINRRLPEKTFEEPKSNQSIFADIDSELEETKCDVQNLFSQYADLDKRISQLYAYVDKKTNNLIQTLDRLEESLINRIQENTNYISKTKSEEQLITASNVVSIIETETQSGYKKLSDHNKLMINQIIGELNSTPDSCLSDYDIIGKVDHIREVK